MDKDRQDTTLDPVGLRRFRAIRSGTVRLHKVTPGSFPRTVFAGGLMKQRHAGLTYFRPETLGLGIHRD